jgi:hypothetical protein
MIDEDALEKSAIATREDYISRCKPNHKSWAEIDEGMRDVWRQHARAAITTYLAAVQTA